MISDFITGLLMVVGTVGVAILGMLLVRRLVPLDFLQMHHEVGGYMIGVMGTVYAVILAFIVFFVWNQYQIAASAVVAEANGVGDLSQMIKRLPEPLQSQLRGALVNYLQVVIDSEWPAMGSQNESQEAWSAMQNIWEIYRRADIPRDEHEQIFYSQSLQQMNTLSNSRRARLFAGYWKVPTLIWVLLWLEGAIILGFTNFRRPKHPFSMPDDYSLRSNRFSEPLPDSGAGSTFQWIGANIADAIRAGVGQDQIRSN